MGLAIGSHSKHRCPHDDAADGGHEREKAEPMGTVAGGTSPMNRRDEQSVSRRRDTPPPKTGTGEKDVLLGFLDYLRDSIAAKVAGTREPALREPGVPSGTNLLGLITHLTAVERFIFLGARVHSWPDTFHADDDQSVDDVLAAYRETVDEVNTRIRACDDLEQPARELRAGEQVPSMRWALVHLIEETGRHAGHADILRELIDGRTGR